MSREEMNWVSVRDFNVVRNEREKIGKWEVDTTTH